MKTETMKRTQQRVQRKIAVSQKYFDYTLLFVVVFLVCFGLVMIYSTSSYSATIEEGDSLYYLKRQALFAAAGFAAIFVITRFDYHTWTKFLFFAYIVAIILQVLVFVPGIGVEVNGSRRWIKIISNSFRIQPSEIGKLVLIMFLAYVCSITVNQLKNFWGIVKVMALALPIIVLVVITNLSTAIVLTGITFVIVFVASDRYKPFIAMIGIVAVGGMAGLMLQGYRMQRIEAWLNVETSDYAYQTRQALYAIGSGGLFGKGLGNSIQKLGAIPEAYNDMIFAIVCEELGIFGAGLVILMFIYLLYRLYSVAQQAEDLFGRLLTIGVFSHVALQVILNLMVVTSLFPTTGVTLPFFSYGGTATVFLLVEIGMVLNVEKESRFKREREMREARLE